MIAKSSILSQQYTITSRGKLLHLKAPILMGILNATPDSFYTGGQAYDTDTLVHKSLQMLAEGAQIIDVGGLSTRPGSQEISTKDEIGRIAPVIAGIRNAAPDAWISVDTYRSAVAAQALELGADIINDISGGHLDDNMLQVCAQYNAPYIAMHMQGTPATMQLNPHYEYLMDDILTYFRNILQRCHRMGVHDVILDPGFGFGKTIEHNYSLLKKMGLLKLLGKPILIGISRKRMLYETIQSSAHDALNATTAAHMLALLNGAQILRVHDIKAAKECIQIFEAYQQAP
jgi:dihydropteroate synthase